MGFLLEVQVLMLGGRGLLSSCRCCRDHTLLGPVPPQLPDLPLRHSLDPGSRLHINASRPLFGSTAPPLEFQALEPFAQHISGDRCITSGLLEEKREINRGDVFLSHGFMDLWNLESPTKQSMNPEPRTMAAGGA